VPRVTDLHHMGRTWKQHVWTCLLPQMCRTPDSAALCSTEYGATNLPSLWKSRIPAIDTFRDTNGSRQCIVWKPVSVGFRNMSLCVCVVTHGKKLGSPSLATCSRLHSQANLKNTVVARSPCFTPPTVLHHFVLTPLSMYTTSEFTHFHFQFNAFWLAALRYANLSLCQYLSFYLRQLIKEHDWGVKRVLVVL
jgi:hypothetical protein